MLNKSAKKVPALVKVSKTLNIKPGTLMSIILGIIAAYLFLIYGMFLIEGIATIMYPGLKSIEAIQGKTRGGK